MADDLFSVMSMGAVVVGMVMMIMIVMGAVLMAMIMMVTVVATMVRMLRRVGVAFTSIGAALRIKWSFDLNQPGSQPSHHRFDHVIASNAQSSRHDLRRQVTVAEMPGDANEVLRVLATNFQKGLGRCDDFDQPAIFEHQRIPTSQGDRVFKVEQELEPARTRHRHATPVAIVKIEHDSIGGGFAPAMLHLNTRRADHGAKFR